MTDVLLTVRVTARDEGRKAGVTILKDGRDVGETGADGELNLWVASNTCYDITVVPPSGYACDYCEQHVCVADVPTSVFFTIFAAVETCKIFITAIDTDTLYGIPNVRCNATGSIFQEQYTGSGGSCTFTVPVGEEVRIECTAPSGFTCTCVLCYCDTGAFTPLANIFDTFILKSSGEENCAQEFRVTDQMGDPVQYAFLEAEDQTDFTTFDISGHGDLGTDSDGEISTLQTISGRAYKFYIREFPAGYDAMSGSIISETACTSQLELKAEKTITGCPVNLCTKDHGAPVPGVLIELDNGAGDVRTQSGVDSFGCTGVFDLQCGVQYTAHVTDTDTYGGVADVTFTPTSTLQIIDIEVVDKIPSYTDDFTLKVPFVGMAGQRKLTGTTKEPNTSGSIMAKRKWFGFDYLARDTIIGSFASNAESEFSSTVNLDEFGFLDIYAKIPIPYQTDPKTATHTMIVMTQMVLAALVILLVIVLDKQYGFLGLKKGGKKRKR